MLELIWRTQTADMGLIYCDSTVAPAMDHILYALPHHVTLNTPAYATYFKQNSRSAQRYLDRLFKLGE
jgi:NADPH-dependent ferric siderophore reductase